MMRTAAILFRKDLTVELRTRESVPAMVLFSLTVFVLFHFGLDRDTIEGSLAAGVLWVTLLLATVLAVTRLFVRHAPMIVGRRSGVALIPSR